MFRIPLALLASAAFMATAGLQGASVIAYESFSPNAWIPDNDAAGYLDQRTIASEIAAIESIQVTIFLTGGWNGDLFAYLAHDSGFAVLLNRIGRTAGNPDGSDSSGMLITFDDAALDGDIHTAPFALNPGTGFAMGSYAPDGRTANPFNVTDLNPSTALLSSFEGLPANGTWELFVADLAPGGDSFLVSWELQITGMPIPEPATPLLLLTTLGTTLLRRRRPLPANTSR